jgi:hypothetical protein
MYFLFCLFVNIMHYLKSMKFTAQSGINNIRLVNLLCVIAILKRKLNKVTFQLLKKINLHLL